MRTQSTLEPQVVAMWQNAKGTVTIYAYHNLQYSVIRNGATSNFDMSHWYISSGSVINHIENDIAAGYYPGVRRVG